MDNPVVTGLPKFQIFTYFVAIKLNFAKKNFCRFLKQNQKLVSQLKKRGGAKSQVELVFIFKIKGLSQKIILKLYFHRFKIIILFWLTLS